MGYKSGLTLVGNSEGGSGGTGVVEDGRETVM